MYVYYLPFTFYCLPVLSTGRSGSVLSTITMSGDSAVLVCVGWCVHHVLLPCAAAFAVVVAGSSNNSSNIKELFAIFIQSYSIQPRT